MNGFNGWLKVVHATSCDEAALERVVAEGLASGPAVRVVGAPAHGDPLLFWRRIGDTLAGEAKAGPEDWSPIRPEPCSGLHSVGGEGDIDLYYMERGIRHGGEMLLVDVETVAACLVDEDPILHDALLNVPVAFTDGNRRPVLQAQVDRLTLRWQPSRVAPGQGGVVEALCGGLAEFLEDLEAEGRVASLRLVAGDALFLRAGEVLIGASGRPGAERGLWQTRLHPARPARRRAAA